MRLVFAGSPSFATTVLEGLVSRHEVCLVLTQAPEAVGRGRRLRPTDVALAAERLKLPVLVPRSLRAPHLLKMIQATGADAAVIAAYGRLLPASWLALFPLGALNVHASLLPRWRGASPIAHAILAGDAQTGVSIMRMSARLDDGPVYRRCPEPILASDTAGALGERLARLGTRCLLEVLDTLATNPTLVPDDQNEDDATYAPRLRKEDGHLDWTLGAEELERRVRAFTPWPRTYAFLDLTHPANRLVVHEAIAFVEDSASPPGMIIAASEEGIDVACGSGRLRITQLQRSGKPCLKAGDFLRGWRTPLLGRRLL